MGISSLSNQDVTPLFTDKLNFDVVGVISPISPTLYKDLR